jgi:hypothetical protein
MDKPEEGTMAEFQTNKNDITKSRLVESGNRAADFTLGEGEVLAKVERFSFTANNVTYGAVGEQIGYWEFFAPSLAADESADEWGIVPVWGFAEIVASNNPDIHIGERSYGYFPLANFLKMLPIRVSDTRFVDGAAHRSALPAVYNSYDRLGAQSGHAAQDNLRALLNPLYGTSFCLVDALQEEAFRNAAQVVILSASSKTAIGLAFGLSRIEGDRPAIIGLTSPGNTGFVEATGSYDTVIGYDALDALPNQPSVLVDMSGNRSVLGAVHGALGDNMLWCHSVGLTHWDDSETKKDPAAAQLIQERSAMFFAPGHIARRTKEWGAMDFNEKVAGFLAEGMAHAGGWIQVHETQGLAQFGPIYDRVVKGDMRAEEGIIITP